MTYKPSFIREVEKALKRLEGRSFTTAYERFDEELGLSVNVVQNPSAYLEDVAIALVNRTRASIARAIKEPNGNKTFPDFLTIFRNNYTEKFEVKSWWSGRIGWAAASVNKFQKAAARRDPLYFTTWFIDFNIKKTSRNTYLIQEVRIGKIWDFADGILKTGSTPSYKASLSTKPETFIENTLDDEAARDWAMSFV